MSSSFRPWLHRLEGKPDVRIAIQIDDEHYEYTGSILLVEEEVCLIQEKGKNYLIRVDDIIELCGDEKLFKARVSRKPGKTPFWRWLKHLEGKDDVDVVTQVRGQAYSYNGKVVKVETDLCLFEERWKSYLFDIKNIVEISGPEALFKLRAEVEIEEIKEE